MATTSDNTVLLDFAATSEGISESFEIVLHPDRAPQTAAALLANLPMQTYLHSAKVAGHHFLWHAPFVLPPEATSDVMAAPPGSFMYWPQRQFLEIVYAPLQPESAAVTWLGQVTGDIDRLKRLGAEVARRHGRAGVRALLSSRDPSRAGGAEAPVPAGLEALVAARHEIWRQEPEEVLALSRRTGLMMPTGPLIMGEGDARKLQEGLWFVRKRLVDGTFDEARAADVAAVLIESALSVLDGLCGLHQAGAVLRQVQGLFQDPPCPMLRLVDETILYVGRLAAWLDTHMVWNDWTQTYHGVPD